MPCVSNRCGGVAAEGKSLAKMYGSKYMEVSAILNHKVDDLLVSAVKQIRLCSGGRRRRYGDAEDADAGMVSRRRAMRRRWATTSPLFICGTMPNFVVFRQRFYAEIKGNPNVW